MMDVVLTTDTKKKIDSARDILVGKIPDPKAQVDQITTALLYKFMDDMDQEAKDVGGKARYFTDEYEKYAWHKIMDPKIGAQDRMNLYSEAITKFKNNPNLPPLFRDIFKDAFLSFRSPETLNLFLKQIDEFKYDHSENLGDAYEYLLSIMGSQGDAGQFRTPRHVIDFTVSVVDPKKEDAILDPACGTAGFLISAYKHILAQHDGKNNTTGKDDKTEKPLSSLDKRQITKNFVGYDISPDMVRISQVNMFLHDFTEPKIYEYDTLSSEDRWDEKFDVILANPPFMTPKGGIQPHKKFQIQAKRSEVLFVDYIMEHLRPKGRAGIIVPEGIIFKSENAYKQLRKKLVEDGLFCVVSLPSGVFNPYAGVKTSILLFDNDVAKKADSILFVKIENDGFDLGAQRRPIDKNDLPEALEVIKEWREGHKKESSLASWVKKEKIAESGDYNLTGDRYREKEVRKNQKWPIVNLGNEKYFQIESGGTPDSKNKEYWGGDMAWVTLVDLPANNRITEIKETQRTLTELGLKKSSAKPLPKNSVLVSSRATIGRIGIATIPLATNQGFKNIIIKDFSKVDPFYIANVLTQKVEEMQRLGTGGTYKEISKTNFSKIKVPLPPLEVQKEIVEQIEIKQKAIDAAKEVIKNLQRERRYFAEELRKLEDVEFIALGDTCDIFNGSTPTRENNNYWENGTIPWFTVDDIREQGRKITHTKQKITKEALQKTSVKLLPKKSVLLCCTASVGEYAFAEIELTTNQQFNGLMVKKKLEDKLIPEFLFWLSGTFKDELNRISGKTSFNFVSVGNLKKVKIPIPSLKVQKQLVAEAEREEEIIEANKRLIEIYEEKINKLIESI